jgi:spore maturation protein CgeB
MTSNTAFDFDRGRSNSASMEKLSILYLGTDSGTSRHRARSLTRLRHKVQVLDPYSFLPAGWMIDYWNHHTGALGSGTLVRTRVLGAIRNLKFDLVWVDGGDVISPELVCALKRQARFVINYNLDDPYGARDSKKWRLYLRSVSHYDLIVVVRNCNLAEAYQAGAKAVLRVDRSSDELAHAPRKVSAADQVKWGSEVAFLGTWMPERGPFLARLVELGVPLSIWGNRWAKADEWPMLRQFWRGPALENEDDYAMALQCAKVCIGLLSKGNRDLCTQRSFEIPHLGGVFCSERTPEHLALYQEDLEAVFWSDADECAGKCKRLLNDEHWRKEVGRRGHLRSLRNGLTNEAIMKHIVFRTRDRVCTEESLSC